jgi:catechol 2,3-dioxygenase-like lactoylglutathione lyase family enzyme
MTDGKRFLARAGLDFGLGTDNEEAVRKFYESIGLTHLMTDPLMPGQDEVYYTMHASWLKFVTSDRPMTAGVSGYHTLMIANPDATEVEELVDPDGTCVQVVPVGHRDIEEIGVVMQVNNVAAQEKMLIEGARAERVASGGIRLGNTVFFLEKSSFELQPGPMFARGFQMVTYVVDDIAAAHASLIDAGARHGLRICGDPVEPGRCMFSFVQDPNGNWIELVQFSELSPNLPPATEPAPTGEQFLDFRDRGIPF